LYKFLEIIVIFGWFSLLVACGSLPKPFAHSGAVQNNPLISPLGGRTVRVFVDEGLPDFLSGALSRHIVRSLRSENVLASLATDFKASYSLDCLLKIIYLSKTKPEKIEITLVLSDSSGAILGTLDYKFSGGRVDWLVLDQDPLSRVVAPIGKDVLKLLYSQKNLAQSMPPIAIDILRDSKLGPIEPFDTLSSATGVDSFSFKLFYNIFVAEIVGAPGDGNNSLQRSMREFLSILGKNVVLKRSESDFLVRGFVNVSPPYESSNDVAITWLVTTNEGRELGKLAQKNKVEAGSLNNSWGKIADIVTEEGSVGILEIIDRFRLSRGL